MSWALSADALHTRLQDLVGALGGGADRAKLQAHPPPRPTNCLRRRQPRRCSGEILDAPVQWQDPREWG